MIKKEYPFNKLPFSDLFNDYIYNFENLKEFYNYPPFAENSIKQRIEHLSQKTGNKHYIEELKKYHNQLGISQLEQLNKLDTDNAVAFITGQQLGVLGGPLYTIYKTITAIILAKETERKYNIPVVPVFWLADEDHDFEEVAWLGIPGNNNYEKLIYNETEDGRPVSNYEINDSIDDFKNELKALLINTDFSEDLWDFIDRCYNNKENFASSFAKLIDNLFGKHGLLIVGSNTHGIKQLIGSELAQSIQNSDNIDRAIKEQTSAIEANYHSQVNVGDSNLFFIDKDGIRIKIDKNGNNNWNVGDKVYTSEQLVDEISQNPQNYSPNVFLRPIIQDKLLPCVGYVAGPGETAYYAQMKLLYEAYNMQMPIIVPRISATLVESGIERIMNTLPFDLGKYKDRVEDIISEYIAIADKHDIESIFDEWKGKLYQASQKPAGIISEIDGSLEGTVGKTIAQIETNIDQLKGRLYRSLKQQEQIQIQRIKRIKEQLYPDGGLQERGVSFLYFMNKYGLGIWDDLIDVFSNEDLKLNSHYIIEL